MQTFKAYRIFEEHGKVEARFVDMHRDELDAGEVTIRNLYASVNFKDALAATGKAKLIRRFPCIGGVDAAGVVDSSTDPRFSPGDEVVVHGHAFGIAHNGGYAPLLRVPGDWPVHLPEGLTLLDAITLGVAGYTAALAVDLLELNGLRREAGKVLVNGATGGVASVAIDLLSTRGYDVVALTRKPTESAYLRSLGANEVLDARDITMGTKPLEQAQWAGAVDSLGGSSLAWLTRTMRTDGVIASVGNAAGIELQTTVMPFILRGVRLIGVNSDNPTSTTGRIWQRIATDLRPRQLGRIARVIPFESLPQAINDSVEGRVRGRTVIEFA